MSRLRPGCAQDAWAGGLFALAGVGMLFVTSDYPIGAAARMGPGYFPQLLGWALTLLGGGIFVLAWRMPVGPIGNEPVHAAMSQRRLFSAWLAVPLFWLILAGFGRVGLTGLDLALGVLLALAWFVSRPLFWVSGGVALFALALESLGLVVASLLLVMVARRAEPTLTISGALALWCGLLLLSLLVFVWGLGTPFPVWPGFLKA